MVRILSQGVIIEIELDESGHVNPYISQQIDIFGIQPKLTN